MKRRYDLRRNPELRGLRYSPSRLGFSSARPSLVDLRLALPPVFDQGEESSCGPNSADGFMCFLNPDIGHAGGFSRHQIYYGVRALEGDIGEDGGVDTQDLFEVLVNTGAAPETLWPYMPANFKVAPTADVLEAASKYRVGSYSQLVSEEDFLDCLAEGFPFILGIELYESFEGDKLEKTGVLARPNVHRETDLGGHDVLAVGYNTNFLQSADFRNSGLEPSQVSNTALLIRNSWGIDWGLSGHFWLPIDYASNAHTGGDAWTGRA